MICFRSKSGNSSLVQGRSGPPSDENELKFRFSFFLPSESWALRACAAHYRTSFVSTSGNRRGDFPASLDRCATVCTDKRSELDGQAAWRLGDVPNSYKQHSESRCDSLGRRRGKTDRETGVPSRDGVSQEHYSGDTTVGRLSAREVCAMGLQADRNPPATATQITVWELHGYLSWTAFGLIEPTAPLLTWRRERCVASRLPRCPASNLKSPAKLRQATPQPPLPSNRTKL